MSIFLIRHGETALNAARVLQPADTELSERGLAQAAALARRLAGLGVGGILSSDLLRAFRTAEAIAASTGVRIETTELLHERNFGDLRGRPYDSLAHDPIASAEAPPGGESTLAFEARCAAAFAQLVSRAAATRGHLAVVTHGLVIRTVLARHAAPDPDRRTGAHLGNTSLSILAPEPPHRVERFNCTLHLGSVDGDDRQALSGG